MRSVAGRGLGDDGGHRRPRRATAEGEERGGAGHEQDADAERGPARGGEVADLDAGAEAGVDARRAVGVHHDDRPVAVLGVPRDRLATVAGGRRGPDVLARGRRGAAGAAAGGGGGGGRGGADGGGRAVGGGRAGGGRRPGGGPPRQKRAAGARRGG